MISDKDNSDGADARRLARDEWRVKHWAHRAEAIARAAIQRREAAGFVGQRLVPAETPGWVRPQRADEHVDAEALPLLLRAERTGLPVDHDICVLLRLSEDALSGSHWYTWVRDGRRIRRLARRVAAMQEV